MITLQFAPSVSSSLPINGDEGIPYWNIRSGSSKGIVFRAKDLPYDADMRKALLLSVMGAPDNVEGYCGHNQVTKKMAVIGSMWQASEEVRKKADALGGADIFYDFYQYTNGYNLSTAQSCINVFAGLGGLAIKQGWIDAGNETTRVRVYKTNTNSISTLDLITPDGQVVWEGDTAQDGIKGSLTAPVIAGFDTPDIKKLLPTGKQQEMIADVPVTLVNYDMALVIVDYLSLVGRHSFRGNETREELQNNKALWTECLNPIRREAAKRMGIADPSTTPKFVIAMPAGDPNVVCDTFCFINNDGEIHKAIGGMMAVGVAAAACMDNSTIRSFARAPLADGEEAVVKVGHPSGTRSFYAAGKLTHEHVFKGGRIESTAWYMGKGYHRPNPGLLKYIYANMNTPKQVA